MYRARLRTNTGETRLATSFPSLRRKGELSRLEHMFCQDLIVGLMPLRREQQLGLTIALSGDDSHVRKATTLLESIATHKRNSINELVCDAMETLARHIAWHGAFVVEIVRDKTGAPLLHNFTPQRLFNILGFFVQIIPAKDRAICGKSVVFVPGDDIWKISVPESLGGLRGFRRLQSRLHRFDSLPPKFWRNALERGEQKPYFDFQWYVRETDLYHATTTRDWGWNKRDYSQKNWTEIYGLYRSLLFKGAQAQLREHFETELNQLFDRLGLRVRLSVAGLPSVEHILEVKNKLLRGEIEFTDAYEACGV